MIMTEKNDNYDEGNVSGVLYIVATPIGNLEDITLRAIRILGEVDFIAAEDTRHSLKLLNHLNIKKPLISYHEHNKRSSAVKILQMLKNGNDVALITDAGTPAISDPGEDLVRAAYENSIKVIVVPGSSALIAGLVVSGLSTRRFLFEGFLPTEKKERKNRLAKISNEESSIILYEAPHKLISTLKDIYDTMGDRNISMVRELTKKHEEVVTKRVGELIEMYNEKSPKGEIVLIIEGKQEINDSLENKEMDLKTIMDEVDKFVLSGLSKKDSIKITAEKFGLKKRIVYNLYSGNKEN
jgi:16S rRNA (cytidine1402-2'-O)-methyltransferase